MSKVLNLKFVLVSILLVTQVGYSKNNDSLLGTIFKNFAVGVLSEVSEHAGQETAKFFLTDTSTPRKEYRQDNLETTLSNIVFNWNDSVDKRDTNKLFNLYGYTVLYYGSKLSDTKCIEDKNRFYKRYPYFTQAIENIRYKQVSKNLYKVSFDKYVKLRKSQSIKNYPSYLVIDTSYSTPLIMVEGDKITDKNLLKKYKNK